MGFRVTKEKLRLALSPHPKIATWYEEYLLSDAWKTIRRNLFKQRGKRCERCKQKRPDLVVHHITYARVTNEHTSDLQILCIECHLYIHKICYIPHIERIYNEDMSWKT